MNILCNLATKKIESFSRWDDIDFNSDTHIVLDIDHVPDVENESLNNTNDAIINAPPAVLIEENRILAIKAEAQKRIVLQLPEGEPSDFIIKELNLLMLNAELDDILINGGALDIEQQAQKDAFIVLKDNIKLIRAMSNDAEINGDTIEQFIIDLDAL